MLTSVNRSDFGAGLIMAGTSAVFLFLGRNLDQGSAVSMGPGYFPRYVAIISLLIGLLLLVRSFKTPVQPLPSIRLRPLIFMLGSVLFFGLFIDRLGLAATAFVTLLIAGVADQWRPVRLLVTSTVVTIFVCVIFLRLLNVPFPLWPTL